MGLRKTRAVSGGTRSMMAAEYAANLGRVNTASKRFLLGVRYGSVRSRVARWASTVIDNRAQSLVRDAGGSLYRARKRLGSVPMRATRG